MFKKPFNPFQHYLFKVSVASCINCLTVATITCRARSGIYKSNITQISSLPKGSYCTDKNMGIGPSSSLFQENRSSSSETVS